MNALVTTRLTELEAVIERGLQTFVDVGTALMEIRDSRLYRESHGTFEEYCRERWGFTDRRARMMIAAAEVAGNLQTGTIVPVLPTTESQARPLTSLPADTQREVWQRAVETAPRHGCPHAQGSGHGHCRIAEKTSQAQGGAMRIYGWNRYDVAAIIGSAIVIALLLVAR